LVTRLIAIARNERIVRLSADVLTDNRAMIAIFRRAGFTLGNDPQDGTVHATLNLA
jgi:RimJ/RimL family protein N-acetyltransferase